MLKRFICTLFFIGWVSPSFINAQEIKDIIQPVKISLGKTDTLIISDLFYAKSYDLKFCENKKINILFEPSANKIILKPKSDFSGMTLIEFIYNGASYNIPVFTQSKIELIRHKFAYKPDGKVKKVSVVGSFNNWDKEKNPLIDYDNNGIYETEINLEPGSYVYKFNVDGQEILDPSNNETVPTGFETFNSVLRISSLSNEKNYLHIDRYVNLKSSARLSFIYENNNQKNKINVNDVIALCDNQKIVSSKIRVTGNKIELNLSMKELIGEKTIRVAVTQNGKTTNIQQVILENGIPAGNKKTFNWYDASFYSIMVDRFNDGDKSNSIPVVHDSLFYQANYQGGDFQGIINKIEEGYFNNLGVNVLWLSPVYDNPDVAFREYPPPHRWYSGYHGYWPVSDVNVEEKFGTMEKLQELVQKAHEHSIKVVLDIVAHHVHIDNPLYKEHPDWFGTLDLPDGRKNLRLWDEYRLTTWFEPYMPSFDYTKSDEPINFMAENCLWWLNKTGADGFRHDAVKHVPNEFWRALTRHLKEKIEYPLNKKVYQIGETFGDNDLVGSYVNNGQLSAQFNFNLSYSAIPIFLEKDKSFSTLDFHINKAFASFGVNNLMGNIMDSHDKVRFMAYADDDIGKQGIDTRELAWNNPPVVDNPSSYKKAELYYAFMFTIPGLPFIYYGSEFGMTGADDPDNRRMMRFGEQLNEYEKAMLKKTGEIVKMRNSHPALRYGDFQTLVADNNIYAYLRTDMNEQLLIVLNKSTDKQNIKIDIPKMYNIRKISDINSGEEINLEKNSVYIQINEISWRVFKTIK